MRKRNNLVYGVGVNDAAYHVTIRDAVDGLQKITWLCPFYRAWTNMLRRCYSAGEHARYPTYIGCAATPEWHSFLVFRAWMMGMDWEGNHLDKDILIPGNKVYSPGTCVFLSSQLNSFITDRGAARGDHPIGVDMDKRRGKFRTQCSNPFTGKHESLGYFTCPDAAHEAWRRRKHELACIYADQQADPRIAEALRARYADHG